VTRLFGVPRPELEAATARLVRRGVALDTEVEGWPGRWLVLASAVR